MNTFQAWILDWAAWHEAADDFSNGYQSSTPQYRAMMAQRITEFSSSIPKGCIPPRNLTRLCLGLNAVKDDPAHARFVTAMQRYYIVQHYKGTGVEASKQIAKEYGIAQSTAYEWKRLGERAVEAWLRVH